MIVITEYTVNPIDRTVVVKYRYIVFDMIANESLTRLSGATLSELSAPLNQAGWSDGDLCAALAAQLGRDASDVVMAQPE